MKITDPDKLYEYDYNLYNLSSMYQTWNDGFEFIMDSPRPTSAFLYIESGNVDYFQNGINILSAKSGDIVYIPQGSIYHTFFHNTTAEKTKTILIEFITKDSTNTPFIFSESVSVLNSSINDFEFLFFEIADIFLSPTPSIAAEKSILYKILSSIGYTEKLTKVHSEKFAAISEGIIYIENDPLQEKNINEIASMCHVSPGYFRRLFKEYSGLSPIDYQIKVKLTSAKKMLSHDTSSVNEISEKLGFSDVSYFCKLFKKKTGMTPKEWRNKA